MSTASNLHTFDGRTLLKVIEWSLLLFAICFSTNKVIQGIPSSNEIKGVSGQRPFLIWLFAILCYIIMIIVKYLSNRNVVLDNEKERNEVQGGWQIMNILIYFLICVLSYILCLSYLSIKIRQKFVMYEQSGGFFDWMNKGDIPAQDIDESIQFIILIGILLVIINAFTNLFLYLKNQQEMEKDSISRTIYQSQLVILLFVLTTLLFLFILNVNAGENYFMNEGAGWFASQTGEKVKWFLVFILLIIGSILINKRSKSGFFGLGSEDDDEDDDEGGDDDDDDEGEDGDEDEN